jgi:hypothetical protein
MTIFLDLRAIPSGGFVADQVTVRDATTNGRLSYSTFEDLIAGKHLVLATHGFNVNSADGLDSLSKWDGLSRLPSPYIYVGVLWPGDSRFLPILDYPIEGAVALSSGHLLSGFLNAHASRATGISMISHSLGARTVLEAIKGLNQRISILILMAAAIEENCLSQEYEPVTSKIGKIYVIASRSDMVLSAAFPIGNLVGEVVMSGHPYFSKALGREGPRSYVGIDAPCSLWQIPNSWDYGHGDYLPGLIVDAPMAPSLPIPFDNDPPPRNTDGWKSSWSAGVIATEI